MRRLALLCLLLMPAWVTLAGSAAASSQPAGVEHLVSQVAQTEVNTVHIAPGAQVVIKLVPLPAAGATVNGACQSLHAYVCVNGDFFNPDGSLVGGMVSDGQLLKAVPVLAATPGQEPARQQLLLDKNGCFSTALTLPNGAWQSSGASYTLLRGGQLTGLQVADDINHFVYGHHSRTLIGWRVRPDGNCDSWFMTISATHYGVDLADAGRICRSVGATDCVNLDGGSSTAMSLGGRLVSPLQDGKEHAVHNVWAVISTVPAGPPPAPAPTTTTTIPLPPMTVPVTAATTLASLQATPNLAAIGAATSTPLGEARPVHGTLIATACWLVAVSCLGQKKNRAALKRLGITIYQGWT